MHAHCKFAYPHKTTDCSNISRGKGKRIVRTDIAAYHPGVDVYWQENAWADTKTSVEWIDRKLKPTIETGTWYSNFYSL